jgi:DNA-binding Lrp family transcriptional regulator
MPVTQADLADATGLSAVHTNRSLQRLREDGFIRTYGRKIVVERREDMMRFANFEDTYLHPEGPRLPAAA